MDVYIARQPIFDRRMRIYGYELLYRNSQVNQFEGADDDAATAAVLYNTFLVIGIDDLTGGAMAFINFSKKLLDSDVPLMLPRAKVVVEVLEREKATQATIDACGRLRDLGYLVALDDFILDEDNLPLLEHVDLVKVEFPSLALDKQAGLIQKYKSRVKFLAEKIETREDYQKAYDLGYDYFQGYFFSKPNLVNSKEIKTLNATLFRLVGELKDPEPDFDRLADIISHDLGLSYKLLKLANSAYIGARRKVKTIEQALVTLGTKELHQWVSLMIVRDVKTMENEELVSLSLIRGKLMSLLAQELDQDDKGQDYFYTGIFSLIDVLLNRTMADVLEGLPLSGDVRDALLGVDNDMRRMLDFLQCFERADWESMNRMAEEYRISTENFMELYVNALQWSSRNEGGE